MEKCQRIFQDGPFRRWVCGQTAKTDGLCATCSTEVALQSPFDYTLMARVNVAQEILRRHTQPKSKRVSGIKHQ